MDPQRARVVNEALTWLKTPWHHEGRKKHIGVDCGMFLLEVFERCALIPHVEPLHYSQDFMLHNTQEWFLEIMKQYADIVGNPPFLPGDALIFRHGKIFSHGGLVVRWPLIIHASAPDKCVCYGYMDQLPLSNRRHLIFRYRGFED